MSFLRRSVNDNFWRASVRNRFADAVQLELPLDSHIPVRSPLSVIAVGQMRGSDILRSIAERGPKLIIDTRELPRFDMPGLSRALIFDAIETMGMTYEQKPLPWSKTDFELSSAYLGREMYNYSEAARLANGSALLFVGLSDQQRVIEAFLDRTFS